MREPTLSNTLSEIENDLISRQEVLDYLLEIPIGLGYREIEDVERFVRELPSAHPEADKVARDIATIIENEKDMRVIRENAEQQWIPWKENDDRLRDHYYYLVTHKDYGTPMKAWYHKDVDRFDIMSVDGGGCAYIWDDKITAWMELPKKYGGEKDG